MFPKKGTIKGVWTFEEIKKAQEEGCEIKEIDWYIRYKVAERNPLKNFIQKLYEIEKKKTGFEKSSIKLIRNNLYGKFAQQKTSKDYKIINRSELPNYEEEGWTIEGTLESKYVISKKGETYIASYVNPIISILITSTARLLLIKELNKIPEKDILYTDTDSILYKGDHTRKLKIGEEIGEFKIEAQGTAKILGEKKYYIDNKVKLSGISRRDINKNNIEEEKPIKTKKMTSLMEGIRKGNLEIVGEFKEETIEMNKTSKLNIELPENISEVKE